MLLFPGVLVLAYLVGAIPFGFIVGRLSRGVDVRQYGSGRTGAANVLRTAGTWASIGVFLGDLAKGAGAVLLARLILGQEMAAVAAAIAAILGHDWPVYLKFQGGRGVVTSLGGLLALSWPVGLLGLALGVAIIAVFRYVSLGSMLASVLVAAIMALLVALGWQPSEYLIYMVVAAALIVFQHRDNIARLRAGTERKVGQGVERRQTASRT